MSSKNAVEDMVLKSEHDNDFLSPDNAPKDIADAPPPSDAEKQSIQPAQQTGPPPPPNGGYGWVCTMCCFLINAHTWGYVRETPLWLSISH